MNERPFDIGDRVRLTQQPQLPPGVIDAVFRDRVGTQYRVEYVDFKGELHSTYQRSEELQAVPAQ